MRNSHFGICHLGLDAFGPCTIMELYMHLRDAGERVTKGRVLKTVMQMDQEGILERVPFEKTYKYKIRSRVATGNRPHLVVLTGGGDDDV